MNVIRHLPNQAKGLKPVKEVLLQEFINLAVINEASFTLLKMLNLVVGTHTKDLEGDIALSCRFLQHT